MKKILFLVTLLLSAIPMTAANVNTATARSIAERYLGNKQANGRLKAPMAAGGLRLTHTEFNSQNASQAVYYIFNTGGQYVIVSGDNRAREVLAWGDGELDINHIPCNMAVWLDVYKLSLIHI